MKSIGVGGYLIFPEDPTKPSAVFIRDCLEIDAEPGDVISYRVSVVTSERTQREVRKRIAKATGSEAA